MPSINAEQLNIHLSVQAKEYEKKLKTAEKKAERFSKKTNKSLKKTTKAFGALKAAAGAAAAAMVMKVVISGIKKAVDAVVELENLARVAGVTNQQFQVLSVTAKNFGVGQEKLSDILKDVEDKFGDFLVTGKGPLIDFFENAGKKAGLTAESFKKLSSIDKVTDLFRAIEGLDNDKKTFYLEGLASDLTKLAPMFANNAKKIKDMQKELEKTGSIMGDETFEKARKTKEELNKLSFAIDNNLNESFVKLAPILVSLTKILSDVVSGVDKLATAVAEEVHEAVAGERVKRRAAVISQNVNVVGAGIGRRHRDTVSGYANLRNKAPFELPELPELQPDLSNLNTKRDYVKEEWNWDSFNEKVDNLVKWLDQNDERVFKEREVRVVADLEVQKDFYLDKIKDLKPSTFSPLSSRDTDLLQTYNELLLETTGSLDGILETRKSLDGAGDLSYPDVFPDTGPQGFEPGVSFGPSYRADTDSHKAKMKDLKEEIRVRGLSEKAIERERIKEEKKKVVAAAMPTKTYENPPRPLELIKGSELFGGEDKSHTTLYPQYSEEGAARVKAYRNAVKLADKSKEEVAKAKAIGEDYEKHEIAASPILTPKVSRDLKGRDSARERIDGLKEEVRLRGLSEEAIELENIAREKAKIIADAMPKTIYEFPDPSIRTDANSEAYDAALDLAKLSKQEVDLAQQLGTEFENNAIAASTIINPVKAVLTDMQQMVDTLLKNNSLLGKIGLDAENLEDVMSTVESSMTNAFMAMGDGSMKAKDAFKMFAKDVIAELYRVLIVQKIVAKAMGGIGKISWLGGAASAPVTGKASGGAVKAGIPYMTGESGRELFIPNSAGKILSHANTNKLGRSGPSVTIHQNNTFAPGVTHSELAELIPMIGETFKSSVFDEMQRNPSGSF